MPATAERSHPHLMSRRARLCSAVFGGHRRVSVQLRGAFRGRRVVLVVSQGRGWSAARDSDWRRRHTDGDGREHRWRSGRGRRWAPGWMHMRRISGRGRYRHRRLAWRPPACGVAAGGPAGGGGRRTGRTRGARRRGSARRMARRAMRRLRLPCSRAGGCRTGTGTDGVPSRRAVRVMPRVRRALSRGGRSAGCAQEPDGGETEEDAGCAGARMVGGRHGDTPREGVVIPAGTQGHRIGVGGRRIPPPPIC